MALSAPTTPVVGLPRAGSAGAVVRALRASGGLTRAELSGELGLSRATVSSVLSGLGRDGLLAESSDPGAAARGRPPAQVALARRAGAVVGVDLGRRHVRVVVVDLAHAVLAERYERYDVDGRPEGALDEAERLVREACAEAGTAVEETHGLTLGLPAPLDQHARLGSSSILPGWVGRQPGEDLGRRLAVPVVAENDANLGALAEWCWGAGRHHGDLVYIKAATGIGAGMVLGGRLFRGSGGAAGELGHTTVTDDGAVCRCGNRGCLEVLAGGPALVAQLAEAGVEVTGLPDVVRLAREGNLGCRRVIADAGEAIGLAAANAVSLVNPELVVVGGELASSGRLLLDPLRSRVQRSAMAPASAHVEVVLGTLGERAEVLGAALLVLREAELFAAAT